jgi:hypothetical protein
MKKAIAIILVLFVAGMAFSAGPATGELDVATSVTGFEGIKLSLASGVSEIAAWNALGTDTLSLDLGDDDGTAAPEGTFFVNLRTNKAAAITVGFSGDKLSAGLATDVDYTITTAGGTGYTSAGTFNTKTSTEATNVLEFTSASSGARVVPAGVAITVDQDTWELAMEGDYTTTVTVSIVSGS